MQIFIIAILLIMQPAVYFINNSRAAFLFLAACSAGIFACMRSMGIDAGASMIFAFFSFAADVLIFRCGDKSPWRFWDILPFLLSAAVIVSAVYRGAAGFFAKDVTLSGNILSASLVFLCMYSAGMLLNTVRSKE